MHAAFPLRHALAALCFCLASLFFCSPACAQEPPDFEDDITLGMDASALRKLGAKPCAGADLCLVLFWGEGNWESRLTLRQQKLAKVELSPVGMDKDKARTMALEQLEEFALSPVHVQAEDAPCDAFDLVKRQRMPPEKALATCTSALQKSSSLSKLQVWYVDEERAATMLDAGSLRNAASQHAGVTALLFSAGIVLQVHYGPLDMLVPSAVPLPAR